MTIICTLLVAFVAFPGAHEAQTLTERAHDHFRAGMNALATDPGVFIRSMATRGNLGGLANATADVVSVLDAASRDPIMVETVGVRT